MMTQLVTRVVGIARAVVMLPAFWAGRWSSRFRQASTFRQGVMLFGAVTLVFALAVVVKVTFTPQPSALDSYQSLDPNQPELTPEQQGEVLRTKNDVLFSDRTPGLRENQHDYIDAAIKEGPEVVECLNRMYDADAAAVMSGLDEEQAKAWQKLLGKVPRAGPGIWVAGEANKALQGFINDSERLQLEHSWLVRVPIECNLGWL